MQKAGIFYANKSGTAEVLSFRLFKGRDGGFFVAMREKKEQEEHPMKRIKIFDTTLRDGEQIGRAHV